MLYVYCVEIRVVSMGQGQEVHARRLLQQGQQTVSDHVIVIVSCCGITIAVGWLGVAPELPFVP